MRLRIAGSIAIAAWVLAGTSSLAQADDAYGGTLAVVIENDAFAGTDNNYTSGLKLIYTTTNDAAPGVLRRTGQILPFFPGEGEARFSASYALSQSMFTPSDIEDPNPPLTDRPYAGWLHGDVAVIADTGDRLHSLTLSLGMVGPASLAEEAQTLAHELSGSPEPQGWDTQLGNEPTLLIGYERRWRMLRETTLPLGMQAELMPTASAAVGNVYTLAGLGANLRLGQHIPYDYGLSRVQPGSPGDGGFNAGRFGWYVFAGFEGRAVARDIFLDGNTFRDSRSVDKEPFVGDAQFGFALVWPRMRVGYTHVLRTDSYETQTVDDDFGSFTLSVRF